jgi:hypothetical protein
VLALGNKLKVTTVDQNGVQLTWGMLVGNMNAKLNTHQRGEEKNRLSELLTLLTRVKDAWRNDTMHPKQTYTEEEAKDIMDAVGSFMRRMIPYV